MPIQINDVPTMYSEFREKTAAIPQAKGRAEVIKKIEDGLGVRKSAIYRMSKMKDGQYNELRSEYSKASNLSIFGSAKLALKRIFGGYENTYRKNLKTVQQGLLIQDILNAQNQILRARAWQSRGLVTTDSVKKDVQKAKQQSPVKHFDKGFFKEIPGLDNPNDLRSFTEAANRNEKLSLFWDNKIDRALKEMANLDKLAHKNPKYRAARNSVFLNMYENLDRDKNSLNSSVIESAKYTPVGRAMENILLQSRNKWFDKFMNKKMQWNERLKDIVTQDRSPREWFEDKTREISAKFYEKAEKEEKIEPADMIRSWGIMRMANNMAIQGMRSLEVDKREKVQGKTFWDKLSLSDSIKSTALVNLSNQLAFLETKGQEDDQFVKDAARADISLKDSIKDRSVFRLNSVVDYDEGVTGNTKSAQRITSSVDDWIERNTTGLTKKQKFNVATSIKALVNQSVHSNFLTFNYHGLDDAGHIRTITDQDLEGKDENSHIFELEFQGSDLVVRIKSNLAAKYLVAAEHEKFRTVDMDETERIADPGSLQPIKANFLNEIDLKVKIDDLANLNYDSLRIEGQPSQKIDVKVDKTPPQVLDFRTKSRTATNAELSGPDVIRPSGNSEINKTVSESQQEQSKNFESKVRQMTMSAVPEARRTMSAMSKIPTTYMTVPEGRRITMPTKSGSERIISEMPEETVNTFENEAAAEKSEEKIVEGNILEKAAVNIYSMRNAPMHPIEWTNTDDMNLTNYSQTIQAILKDEKLSDSQRIASAIDELSNQLEEIYNIARNQMRQFDNGTSPYKLAKLSKKIYDRVLQNISELSKQKISSVGIGAVYKGFKKDEKFKESKLAATSSAQALIERLQVMRGKLEKLSETVNKNMPMMTSDQQGSVKRDLLSLADNMRVKKELIKLNNVVNVTNLFKQPPLYLDYLFQIGGMAPRTEQSPLKVMPSEIPEPIIPEKIEVAQEAVNESLKEPIKEAVPEAPKEKTAEKTVSKPVREPTKQPFSERDRQRVFKEKSFVPANENKEIKFEYFPGERIVAEKPAVKPKESVTKSRTDLTKKSAESRTTKTVMTKGIPKITTRASASSGK